MNVLTILLARSPSGLRADGDRAHRQQRRLPIQLRDVQRQSRRRLDHRDDPAHGNTLGHAARHSQGLTIRR